MLPKYKPFIDKSGNVKSNINLIEVHPQLGNNNHIVDGVVVGVGSL